jgi:hypothetical protein
VTLLLKLRASDYACILFVIKSPSSIIILWVKNEVIGSIAQFAWSYSWKIRLGVSAQIRLSLLRKLLITRLLDAPRSQPQSLSLFTYVISQGDWQLLLVFHAEETGLEW